MSKKSNRTVKICKRRACRKEFKPAVYWQNYCSSECRDQDAYERHRAEVLTGRKILEGRGDAG